LTTGQACKQFRTYLWATAVVLVLAAALFSYGEVSADENFFFPGNLVVSRSVYDNNPDNIQVGMTLPPNCTLAGSCSAATNDGTYPTVFNNALADASFGITSKIFLDQITTNGALINSLEVPNSFQNGVPTTKDQMVTSFSSKSEIALNLSTDAGYLTFMGYLAPIDAIDVSNSNTAAVVDPTNPMPGSNYRVVASVDAHGKFRFTLTNAYSGNNGRAAIWNNTLGANLIYMAGNAGNGANPQPTGIVLGAGAQILTPEIEAIAAQSPGLPTPVGSFNITQLGDTADKIGKDTNFRGLTIFNGVLYYTKGSGGNGVNTVYFVDPTGTVCTDTNGIGLPAAGATLPSGPLAYDAATLNAGKGLDPNNMCVLRGFNTVIAKNTTNIFPFGIWFADANTLYVADEGDGYAGGLDLYSHAGAQQLAGLQKWVFDSTLSPPQWKLAYTLRAGLGLGSAYAIGNGYPDGNLNLATCIVAKSQPNPNNCPVSKTLGASFTAPDGLPWDPATDGLRNITGVVNGDGTVTIYAITSTVSGSGDQGADPNRLVAITDSLSAAGPNPPAGESFTTLKSAGYGEVLRGVSFAPGTWSAGH